MIRRVLLLCLIAPGVAWGDVVLDGAQHIGDDESATFTPSDPVERDEFSNSASRFHLTQDIVVTALRLENFVAANPPPLTANQPIRVELDGNLRASTHSNGLITLNQPRALSAGVHTLALDPGCLRSGAYSTNCRRSDDEFDIGFTAITLITADSAQTTLSRNLTQRRHLGDTSESANDNFGGSYYPDAPEGGVLNVPFMLDRNLRLSEVRFYRLREVENSNQVLSRASVSIVNNNPPGDVTFLGSLTGNGNPFIVSRSVSLPAGSYSVRVEAGQMKPTTTRPDKDLDDLRWNDILLLFSIDTSSTPGRFNAVDPGQDPVTGITTTKVAGASLDVDVVAINAGALVTNYVGDVTVELLDATDDSGTLDVYGCRTSWAFRENLGMLAFGLADGGRKRLTAETVDAYRQARLRMTDAVLAVSGCSTDAFATRPTGFTLEVTDGDWETAGTARTLGNLDANVTSPIHKAGRPFTIRATALNARGVVTPGYSGSPTVLAAASLLGANVGEARADLWTTSAGVAQTDSARYSEAGAFVLEVRDTTFAAVDAADTSAELRQIGPATINVGRFVPDHFDVSLNTPEFEHGCGSFTYMGQPFKYRPGFEPQATLTAVAFGAPPTATRNYTGDLYKLPKAPNNFLPGVSTYTSLGPVLDTSAVTVRDNGVSELGEGIALLSFIGTGMVFPRSNTPAVPFDAEIQFTRAIVDSDGITTEPAPVQFGLASTGNGIAFTGGGKEVRFGRLVLDNAYGSERLPLDVPLRTEYWASSGGGSGFVQNLQDNCTSLPRASAVLSGGISASTGVSAIPDPIPLTAGKGAIRLTAPSPSATGQVTVTADLTALLLPWLWIDGDGNNNYSEAASADPSSLASFGLFKNNERRIYQREMVR